MCRKSPMNDSGGAGALSTATDYLRFGQMLLNGGELDGARVISRSTIKLMTSDHLGTRVAAPFQPGELLLGTPGYTFRPRLCRAPGRWGRRRARLRGRVHVGWLRPAPISGRSQGGDRRCLHDTGAEPDPRLLPARCSSRSSIRRWWTDVFGRPLVASECEAAVSRCLAETARARRAVMAAQVRQLFQGDALLLVQELNKCWR